MTVANRGTSSKPVPLTTQITHIEKRILDRQQLIRRYATSCGHDMWNTLTSPAMLLSAGSLGFLVGILTRRQSSLLHERVDGGIRARRLFDGVLKSIALIRTWFPMLRSAAVWLFPRDEASSHNAEWRARRAPRSSDQARDSNGRHSENL